MVVFLHATAEDFLRSTFGKSRFTFSSDSDLRKELKRCGIDPTPFADILPALNQLASHRNRIVHYGDLDANHSSQPWHLVDDWQLIHWNIAVLLLHYRVRKMTGATGMVEDRARENAEKALVKNVEHGKALLALAQGGREKLPEGLKRALEIEQELGEILKLEASMFLDADGNPLPGTP